MSLEEGENWPLTPVWCVSVQVRHPLLPVLEQPIDFALTIDVPPGDKAAVLRAIDALREKVSDALDGTIEEVTLPPPLIRDSHCTCRHLSTLSIWVHDQNFTHQCDRCGYCVNVTELSSDEINEIDEERKRPHA